MRTLLRSPVLMRLARRVAPVEALAVAVCVLLIELVGSHSRDDVDDMLWVLLLPLLFMTGCSLVRYKRLPLTKTLLEACLGAIQELRSRLVLSLGLDFHPDRHPRLPAFVRLRRMVVAAWLAALTLYPARGVLLEALGELRRPGLYTLHVLLLGAVWTVLLAGIAVQVPAGVLGVIEVLKGRTRLSGLSRLAAVGGLLLAVVSLLVVLHGVAGLEGCLAALAFAALLPSVARAVDPPGGPWLNLAFGRNGRPSTAPLGELVRDGHRLFALAALLVLCALAPSGPAADAPAGSLGPYPVTLLMLAIFGWSAAWLYTAGALLAIGEFNRRRRLFDPAFERSRVLWAAAGPETRGLEDERPAIERSGWRLVVSERLPAAEDADLLAGIPAGMLPPCPVPLVRVPSAVFVLAPDPGAVLAEADERDKARRAGTAIERLLTAARPRFGDRGEGTFLVPHCWMVVGLTRDDDRGEGERPPAMTFGQSYQSALGTRLRRFLHEVMTRAEIDVFYIEDSVTPQQFGEVLEALFERHIARTEPGQVSEQDFLGIQGVHVVLHDVLPETEGVKGVDTHLVRNAISRARILIVGKDRRDGGDDDGPPSEGESSDSWLRDALRRLFPRLQPI
ncbi:MAG TPA: hypothetical protein VFD43_11135 [Planctomycetota bacterium]|nr:hypothetical protein [Planctomycetota bacterium]